MDDLDQVTDFGYHGIDQDTSDPTPVVSAQSLDAETLTWESAAQRMASPPWTQIKGPDWKEMWSDGWMRVDPSVHDT